MVLTYLFEFLFSFKKNVVPLHGKSIYTQRYEDSNS